MKQRFGIIILTLIAAGSFCVTLSPHTALAADTSDSKPILFRLNIGIPGSKFIAGQDITLTGATFGEYISALYVFFVGVAGILATVMIIYGGYKYVISRGNAGKMSDARDQITTAITGLVLSLGAYLILLTINPHLVKFDGFQLQSINQKLQGLEEGMSSEKGTPPATWDGNNITTYDATFTTYGSSILGPDGRIWLKALMLIESSGNPNAESPVGACGLMQLLPSTADQYDNGKVDNSVTCAFLKSHTEDSIIIAAKYLRSLLDNTCPTTATYKDGSTATCTPSATKCTNNNYTYAVAAYNGGRGANCSSVTCPGKTWWECEANSGFKETRDYVTKARSAYDKVVNWGWSN